MRRARATAFAFIIATLILPRPAHAWFGWLDNLSGPGKFSGLQYEFRLACFGPESPPKRLAAAITRATDTFADLAEGDLIPNAPRLIDAQNVLDSLIHEIERYRLIMPVYEAPSMDDAMNKLNTARDALRMLPRDDSDANRRVQLKSFRDAIPDTSLAEPGERAVSSMSSSGIFLSLCGNRVERRSSLEAGFYSWKTGGTPEFASNKDIHLDTVMAFYSYRVFDNPKYDVFDIAAGGGVYWFSSEGFETFSGVILQPIRADFHAPSRWASYPWTGKDGRAVKRLLAIPSFRWGAMLFPAGFDQGVFGPPPNPRIGSDLVPTWAVFINFQPLLPHRDFAAKPKGSAGSR